MSLQLREIVLYGHRGEIRRLRFRLGTVNIITGKSGTGKSAIVPIIDYCLGRATFTIPEGFIRDTVAWYGVVLSVDDGTEVFVAKPAPKQNALSQSQAYIEIGATLKPPAFAQLIPNSNDDAVQATLSSLLGISPNLHTPPTGQTREPLEANISHTKFYLFQEQGVVANRDILFFRQSETFLPQAIQDTLPYLLGAVSEDRLATLRELRQLRRQIKMLERDMQEVQAVSGGGTATGQALLAEALQVGLAVATIRRPLLPDEVKSSLRGFLKWVPKPVPEAETQQGPQLRSELQRLRREVREISESIDAARSATGYANAYQEEVGQQKARLEAIEIFKQGEERHACPLCGSEPKVPAPSIAELSGQLQALDQQLLSVARERPRLDEYIDRLDSRLVELRQLVRERQRELASVEEQEAQADEIADQNSRIARTVGRISLYLETQPDSGSTDQLQKSLDTARSRAATLEARLDEEAELQLLDSYLNRIGAHMTRLAAHLPFEHSDYPIRFDIKNLTVVADRPGRPFSMQRMGSAQNYLVCHISALLALHSHFRVENRPVPAFLVIDQPTQVYFPSRSSYRETDGTVADTNESGADLQAVNKLFALLFEVAEELKGQFQMIVLEHANLEDPRYQAALVEPPWDGVKYALVPPAWRP